MNKYRLAQWTLASFSFFLAATAGYSAEQVTVVKLTALPSAVQQTIHAEVGKGKLGVIEKIVDHGEITYDVEMRKANRERDFTVSEDGTLLDMEVFPNETPAAVHAAIKQQAGAGEIERVTKVFDDGDVSFEVETSRSGKECIFILDEKGKLLKAQVFLSETSPAVQKTIQKELGAGVLGDIFKVIEDDGITYEVEINPDGLSRIVTIDEKGGIVSDEEQIPLAKTPEAVQTAIKELAQSGQIGDLTKTTEAGEVTYNVDLKRDGKWDSVSIGTDGKIVP